MFAAFERLSGGSRAVNADIRIHRPDVSRAHTMTRKGMTMRQTSDPFRGRASERARVFEGDDPRSVHDVALTIPGPAVKLLTTAIQTFLLLAAVAGFANRLGLWSTL